ncbi:uncharacterized protein LOC111616254 [Centruroides sculpturatus]|uniref:uncharacterized protein LOC111616254 n=1 Tax=Centruroides sculpturatus TaxID=218467 RepID=UPI000C6D2335|nr:uncharacterized protein LOC111616254 [Centruroides sculpturatus]
MNKFTFIFVIIVIALSRSGEGRNRNAQDRNSIYDVLKLNRRSNIVSGSLRRITDDNPTTNPTKTPTVIPAIKSVDVPVEILNQLPPAEIVIQPAPFNVIIPGAILSSGRISFNRVIRSIHM